MKPIHYIHCVTILLTLILRSNTAASSLDLTGMTVPEARKTMGPITELIAAEQTPPQSFLSYHNSPFFSVSTSFITVSAPEFNSLEFGYPALWLAMSVSPNLTIGANVTGISWLDDNIQTIGPFVSIAWGTPEKTISTDFHFHNLKGPDDFHLTDVALDASRIIKNANWTLGYGISAHYFKVVLDVADNTDPADNYSTTIKINNFYWRFGLYRHIGRNLNLGSELFLNSNNLIGNINIALTF